jgi:hypothetical protein
MRRSSFVTATLAALFVASPAAAQAASVPPTQFLPIAEEAPARLVVDPPLPDRLAAGAVLINYRTENFRILPIFGPGANDVSPRAGHLHVTVDDLPWHWADASGDGTIVVVGLPPGQHSVLIELARPDHSVVSGRTVEFVVPTTATHGH